MTGIRVVEIDRSSPTLRVVVHSPAALEHLRRLPFIDYVEPAVLMSSKDASGGKLAGVLTAEAPLLSSSSGGNDPYYGYYLDAAGNWIPNIYTGMRIPEAWQLSTGGGVTIGLLDTGIEIGQPDLLHWSKHKVTLNPAIRV